DQFKVTAICDLDQARAREAATAHVIPHVSTDLTELCRMDDLDVIDICTLSYLHASQVQQVLVHDGGNPLAVYEHSFSSYARQGSTDPGSARRKPAVKWRKQRFRRGSDDPL
ncbi:MAG: Gfo/Idh/MocA family oxidoreductase, partial [Anaerolineae bacterium]